MGNFLECGGNRTFQNLEQCHEIQGEFKKKPLYYFKSTSNAKENTLNKNQDYINKIHLFDKDREKNLIIYNKDEFGYDNNFNHLNINSDNKSINNNVKKKFNKSLEYKKKEKNKILGNINNNIANNKNNNKNNLDNLIEKEIKNIELNNKTGIRLIYNNSENNIKSKTKDNKLIKKFLNDSKENKKKERHHFGNKIINNLFINKKYKQLNYVQYNNIQSKINDPDKNRHKDNMKTTELIEENNEIKKNNTKKKNKSHQMLPSQHNSECNINTKFRKSLKQKKGNYIFRPKIKTKNRLYIKNEPKRKTYLTSGNTSPKLTSAKFFQRNDNEIINDYKNNTHKNKYIINKFLLKCNSENCINDLINSYDYNSNLNNNKRHFSHNSTNNIKLNKDEKDFSSDNNKYIIKIKIPFKGTQINHKLLNSSVNDIFNLNYNMLSKLSDKAILYDGNIYKVINSKKDESNFVLRYFQITKKTFKLYNNIHSLLMTNEKPLEEFNIKYIRDIEIIDIKLLIKEKEETKIKFVFVINMVENINFYIFALSDIEVGNNIIQILNFIKKYSDKEKDILN